MEKVNQSYISEELIKIFKSSKKFFNNLESLDLKVSYKNDDSPLTILDTEVDNFIRKELKKISKDFSFISEETSQEQTNSKYTWIIDPIDGTTNFLHSFAPYCVSIALWDRTELVLGLVYELAHKQCFYATKGQGAYLDGTVLSVSSCTQPEDSLIATGFPYTEFSRVHSFLTLLKVLFQETHGVRRAGAASYDLCAVAAGWVEGFFEEGLKAWDVAAGGFIVQEAGGYICDWEGGNQWLTGKQIIAGNKPIKKYLLERIQGIYPGFGST